MMRAPIHSHLHEHWDSRHWFNSYYNSNVVLWLTIRIKSIARDIFYIFILASCHTPYKTIHIDKSYIEWMTHYSYSRFCEYYWMWLLTTDYYFIIAIWLFGFKLHYPLTYTLFERSAAPGLFDRNVVRLLEVGDIETRGKFMHISFN